MAIGNTVSFHDNLFRDKFSLASQPFSGCLKTSASSPLAMQRFLKLGVTGFRWLWYRVARPWPDRKQTISHG